MFSTPSTNDIPEFVDIVYAFALHPEFATNAICYAARHSGLYQSEDGGRSWKSMYDSLQPQGSITTLSVCLSPNFLTDQTIFTGVIGGVLRSNDAGQNWDLIPIPLPPTIINLVCSPNYKQDGILLAGTLEDGVFRSNDRGSHWSGWNFGLLNLQILSMAISPGFSQDETLYVGTEMG